MKQCHCGSCGLCRSFFQFQWSCALNRCCNIHLINWDYSIPFILLCSINFWKIYDVVSAVNAWSWQGNCRNVCISNSERYVWSNRIIIGNLQQESTKLFKFEFQNMTMAEKRMENASSQTLIKGLSRENIPHGIRSQSISTRSL